MKVKGFTLIELLAVIVILAIIALIATPIILNIIGDTKNNATLRSGELYLKAVEQAIARENLKEEFNPSTCEIQSDGNLMCGDKTLVVETNGTKPVEGTINLQKGSITTVEGMLLDGYILNKDVNKNLVVQGKLSDITPQGTYLMVNPSGNADTYFLGQEQIKRNQVEKIEIKNRKTVPSNAIYSWDVSAAKDKSVMAWYIDSDNNNLYELYIGGDGGVKANPTSSNLFYYFGNVTTINVKYLNTSEVTDMSSMFSNCNSLTTLDLSSFDTSNVTNMSSMFPNCTSLTSLNLSNFDTGKVTNMNSMFSNCSILATLDISNFNTSQVTNMSSMFQHCSKLTNLNLSSFDTTQATSMSYMFNGCNSITTLDLSNFNTSKVINISLMFNGCSKLTSINMKNAIFESVTNYSNMLNYLNALTTITVKDNDAKMFIEARLADVSKTGVTVTVAT